MRFEKKYQYGWVAAQVAAVGFEGPLWRRVVIRQQA